MQDILPNMLNSLILSLLGNPIILLALVVLPVIGILTSPWFKGKKGEWQVARILSRRLDSATYQTINDVMIPDQEGGTTQIDHVVFSPFGVFVIETKNMKGWIFGNANSATWTQTIYRRKYKFQNPFRQNYKHIKCLAERTGLDERHLIHVIFFIGDCTLKTRENLPKALVTNGRELEAFVTSHQTPVISMDALQTAIARLSSGRIENTFTNRRAHVSHVEKRISDRSDSSDRLDETIPVCPTCGASMVMRKAGRGANTGNAFWGCSKYPKCRGIHNV